MLANNLKNLADAPHLRMELVELDEDGEVLSLDIDRSLSLQQYGHIRGLLSERYGVPEEALVFHERETEKGDAFTEIDCAAIRSDAEAAGRYFNEQNFGREVWDVLFRHGNVIEFDTRPVPLEEARYRQ
jgi:hypothetical protein